MSKEIVVAVAGNPNTGKTTFVNAIAGTRLKVGNWPGVTVEKKEARLEVGDVKVRLVDLPGTYSLSPFSTEEIIARDFLVKERPDVVLNVVDATNLERNLYLTLQLIETGRPVVLVLNMYDEALKRGLRIEVEKLEKLLGIPVVPTVAVKGEGVREALETAVRIAGSVAKLDGHVSYGEEVEKAISEVEDWLLKKGSAVLGKYPTRWLAIKLLEGDQKVSEETGIRELPDLPMVKHLLSAHGELGEVLAEVRYGIASGIVRESVHKEDARPDLSEKLDRLFLNRYLGLPVFMAMMWLLFKLAFDLSSPFVDWLDGLVAGAFTETLAWGLYKLSAPEWFQSLVLDGIVAGVGTVAVFLPVIFAMMFLITFLEGSGYLARAAFVMDRAMHTVGLHGKSFIPLLLGFGCNVPAVYATRVLESRRDRVLTAFLAPLMSCGARLPVYVLFAGAFFGSRAGTVIWSLYMVGIGAALLLGAILQRLLFRGEATFFVMELPPYRLPRAKYLLVHTWEKTRHFVVKAGTYILAMSIAVWFLFHLPPGAKGLEESYLGRLSKAVAPVFSPLGFGNWEAAASLVTGFLAKEVVVSTMGEIYGLSSAEEDEIPQEFPSHSWGEVFKGLPLAFVEAGRNLLAGLYPVSLEPDEAEASLLSRIREVFTPLSAYAFMVFVLLYVPCMVVLAAFYMEFRSLRLTGLMLISHFALAYGLTYFLYQAGKLLGYGG
ncbi:ferrous iron transport protein B [Thermosulfurimonas dismutans]|uniref:Ferrous iron transport protein B n=1 Tax=Thermosulfurimonas dismutans TaxID=999894 RepID=A0A179D1Y3_9BACT|nr:ferrous iron transport protein B [Thermosulfurimonas dismutans]OAQ20066.1 Ferrous iron transport protein FeoB [Thermosulfurimonas dismutans]